MLARTLRLPLLSCLPRALPRWLSASPTKKRARAAAAALGPPSALPPRLAGLALRPLALALVGRPNVGKSSLFNRLVRARLAIVNAQPGTTRDWKESPGSLGALQLTVLDTGGLEAVGGRGGEGGGGGAAGASGSVEARMLLHTERAIAGADLVLFMVDARAGIGEEDERFARWVKARRPQHGVLLGANKPEGLTPDGAGGAELVRACYRLGFGAPVLMSAEHGEGLGALYAALEPHALVPAAAAPAGEPAAGADLHGGEAPGAALEGEGGAGLPSAVRARLARSASGEVAVAVVGRPNVGKSTLVNALLGRERCLVGPTPGLTRDATAVPWAHPALPGRSIRLVDTAGMRRAGAQDLTTPLEGLAVGQSKKALALAHVVVLVADGSGGTAEGLTDAPQTFAALLGSGAGGQGAGGSQRRGAAPALARRPGDEKAVSRQAELVAREASAASAAAALAPPPQLSLPVPSPAERGQASRASGQALTGRPYGLTRADLAIASQVLEEGRGLVVALNKVDAAGGEAVAGAVARVVRAQLDALPQGRGAHLVPCAALRGVGCADLFPAIMATHDAWCARVSTGRLNAWLALVMRHHPPPSIKVSKRRGGGRALPRRRAGSLNATSSSSNSFVSAAIPVRIKYISQINARPPTFAAFTNTQPARFPESYKRFLVNALREEFDLWGVPVRFLLRRTGGPRSSSSAAAAGGGGERGGVRVPGAFPRARAAFAQPRVRSSVLQAKLERGKAGRGGEEEGAFRGEGEGEEGGGGQDFKFRALEREGMRLGRGERRRARTSRVEKDLPSHVKVVKRQFERGEGGVRAKAGRGRGKKGGAGLRKQPAAAATGREAPQRKAKGRTMRARG